MLVNTDVPVFPRGGGHRPEVVDLLVVTLVNDVDISVVVIVDVQRPALRGCGGGQVILRISINTAELFGECQLNTFST